MNKEVVVKKTIEFVKIFFENFEGSHDWHHTERVCRLAKKIAETEKADMFIVELGALLHDVADYKFNNRDEEAGSQLVKEFLVSLEVESEIMDHIVKIVKNVSFRGGNFVQEFKSTELDIVQDADKLDAMGAIGIARVFAYGGSKNKEIHNPEIKPKLDMKKEEYKNNKSSSINHFYEKLLLLKDLMNTDTGKAIAEHRHEFMEQYLTEFYKEWNGEI